MTAALSAAVCYAFDELGLHRLVESAVEMNGCSGAASSPISNKNLGNLLCHLYCSRDGNLNAYTSPKLLMGGRFLSGQIRKLSQCRSQSSRLLHRVRGIRVLFGGASLY